jgi:hypothetical protein
MNEAEQEEIHIAVNAALDELAEQLGGTSETGGPVENATQVKGRGDLGVLLTDVHNNVLGRVWVSFDAGISVPTDESLSDGSVAVRAEVLSEHVSPPIPLDEWMHGR